MKQVTNRRWVVYQMAMMVAPDATRRLHPGGVGGAGDGDAREAPPRPGRVRERGRGRAVRPQQPTRVRTPADRTLNGLRPAVGLHVGLRRPARDHLPCRPRSLVVWPSSNLTRFNRAPLYFPRSTPLPAGSSTTTPISSCPRPLWQTCVIPRVKPVARQGKLHRLEPAAAPRSRSGRGGRTGRTPPGASAGSPPGR